MDWTFLKPMAGKLAQSGLPYLGQIIGDAIPFPGGSIAGRFAGEWAGNKIAELLGVPPTPEAVSAAIEGASATELQAKLAAGENEAQAKWEAAARIAEAEAADRTAQSQAINETSRAETVSGVSFWHWRHQLGYLVLFQGYTWTFAGIAAMFGRVDVAVIVALMNAFALFTGGLFALLGYVAQDSTKRVTTAITGEHAPSATDNVVAAVKKVVVGKQPAVTIAAPAKKPLPGRSE